MALAQTDDARWLAQCERDGHGGFGEACYEGGLEAARARSGGPGTDAPDDPSDGV